MDLQVSPRKIAAYLLVIVLFAGFFWAINNIGYYWVMLVPNVLLLMLTMVFLVGYVTLKDKELPKNFIYPSLSIIVPMYNSEKSIVACIDSIKKAHYPGPKEIIIIDDGSIDDSARLVGQIDGIKLIKKMPNAGKAAGLNDGIRMAKGELVACIDSDTYLDENALICAVEGFTTDKVGAVTVLIRVANKKNLLTAMQDMEYSVGFGLYAFVGRFLDIIFVTPGPMTVFRKEALLKVGLFDETNITEDLEMAWRLREYGYSIDYALDALVYTDVPETVKSLLRQRLRWYRGKLVNLRKYKHMVFNEQYGEFGTFMLPFTFTAELTGVTLTMTLGVLLIKQLSWAAIAINSTMQAGLMPTLETFPLSGTSGLFMAIILLLPWFAVALLSRKLTTKQVKVGDTAIMFLSTIIYSIFISFAYFLSFFMEMSGAEYKW